MKALLSSLLVVAACVAPCEAAPAPFNLNGRTVVLNYTMSQYSYTETDSNIFYGWEPYHVSKQRRTNAAEAFYALSLKPKATRNLLPITSPRQGGKYMYSRRGGSVGVIEVDSEGGDYSRTITITFTTPTTGVATETVGAGCFVGTCRNIMVTIK